MFPSEAAKSIQQRLEQASGKPVVIDRSNEPMGYATIRIAAVDAPAHLFRYKPEFEPELPYLLAFQCGLALRTVEAKPGNRFDVSSTDAISIELPKLVREHLRAHSPQINDPDTKYTLNAIPGRFSGLHLVAMMYAAFQHIAPGTDVGIDFSKEYETAKELGGYGQDYE